MPKTEFIARGSYGCVYTPAMKCSTDSAVKQITHKNKAKSVSKIFVNKEAFDKEVASATKIAKIDPTGEHLMVPTSACSVDRTAFNKMKIKNQEKCSNIEEAPTYAPLYQLIMPFGGSRIDDEVRKHHHGKPYKEFLAMIEPLMEGLVALEKQRLCHQDIKGGNVLTTPQGKGIIIDHNLMVPYDTVYSPANHRRLRMEYYPYPLEFQIFTNDVVYHNSSIEKIAHDYNNSLKSFGNSRYHLAIHYLSKELIEEAIKNILKELHKQKTQQQQQHFMTKYANKVDVYAMGMVFVSISRHIMFRTNQDSKKFDAFVLSMIHPDMTKRSSPEKALKDFKKL